MKIHNPTESDIAEIPVVNGEPVSLRAGETMETTESFGEWMLKTWGFLVAVKEEPAGEPKMQEPVPDEPEPEKPKKAKRGAK